MSEAALIMDERRELSDRDTAHLNQNSPSSMKLYLEEKISSIALILDSNGFGYKKSL